MKQMFAVVALIAVSGLLTGLVFAQDMSRVNGANLRSDGTWQNFDQTKGGPPTAPKYCKPCLFYGGDTDTSSQDWAAWANEDNTVANAVFTKLCAFCCAQGKDLDGDGTVFE
jgi:hypothetical protein